MKSTVTVLLGVALAAGFGNAVVMAQGPSLEAMRARADELRQEADRLTRTADEMQPPGLRPGMPPMEMMHQRIEELKQKIDALHRENRHEEADRLQEDVQRLKHEIDKARGEPQTPGQQPSPQSGPAPRMDLFQGAAGHLHEAARLLHEADVHDLADQMEEQASQIDDRVRQQRGESQGSPPFVEELRRTLQKVMEEVGRLHHEVEQLRVRMDEIHGRPQ